MQILKRLQFAWKHRTLRTIVLAREGKAQKVLVYHRGALKTFPVLCPHQGAPLVKGHIRDNALVCPWHGCRFELDAVHGVKRFQPHSQQF
jgi:nitrite reductase/ring-hydroxylating ferredoxin subunit